MSFLVVVALAARAALRHGLRVSPQDRSRTWCVRRSYQTIQNEFYASAFRRKLNHSLDELQAEVDAWMDGYNAERTHTGKNCYGRTPRQTIIESATLAYDRQLDRIRPISEPATAAS